ncbi:nuclear transport factor 2 family protein [Geodermatophilus sp. YIM 151500]|uniref:YybH family protein n=1 Tax=Geodermatophilus sp. YIM 151500 TaxID=2984531 RepID=UPI0021E48F7C|nr:nuclear transport factor 2 family protein [Geodermatophilus sp. YIM 151500]MCV2490837.1 nuclear transport factor 2 family protein [Geodermatophilus sp. YIM 151500]
MSEVEDFLASTMPRQVEAEIAIHNGDPGPRSQLWSHREPVTLFGSQVSSNGWDEVRDTFHRLASRFANCASYEVELIAAGASGDLAYTVAYEHTTASVEGRPAAPYTLRVTHVYRREDGEWRIVHRHGDQLPDHGDRPELPEEDPERRAGAPPGAGAPRRAWAWAG